MRVLLTKRAEKNYQSIQDYLTKEWGAKVSQAFEQKVIDFIDLIEAFPELGVIEVPEKQIRSFLITKQIRIFYRLKENRIILLSFLM